AFDCGRKAAALQVLAPVADYRGQSENPEMDRAGGVHRAGIGNLAHHQRCLGNPESAAAILLGYCDAQEAGLGHRLVELVWELMARVVSAPVFVGKALA